MSEKFEFAKGSLRVILTECRDGLGIPFWLMEMRRKVGLRVDWHYQHKFVETFVDDPASRDILDLCGLLPEVMRKVEERRAYWTKRLSKMEHR